MFLNKDASLNKDTSLNKDESRVTMPVPIKIQPKSQRAIKGEHVARIDVGTIEVIDRMINRRDLSRDKRDCVLT